MSNVCSGKSHFAMLPQYPAFVFTSLLNEFVLFMFCLQHTGYEQLA